MDTIVELIFLNALLGYSAYIVLGGGTFSMSFPAFIGIGAYTGAILSTKHGLGLGASLLVAIGLALVGSLIISRPLARLSGVYLAIASVSLVAVVQVVLINWRSLTNGATGIFSVPLLVDLKQLALALVIVIGVVIKVDRSSLGRAMRMVRLDPMIASAMGVNVPRLRLGLLVASSILAAIGGVLRVFYLGFAIPQPFGFGLLVTLVAIVLIGGISHWSGPLVGAVIFTLLPRLLQPLGHWSEVTIGIVLLVVVLTMPAGVTGGVSNLIHRYRKRRDAKSDDSPSTVPTGTA